MLHPPGPKPHFLIGNVPLAGRSPLDTFRRWAAEYGDIFYYRVVWMDVYFLNRPDLIEYVLVTNPQNFLKDRVVRNSRWLLGAGLLTNEGESWKRQRRLSQPAFSRERIASYACYMTDSADKMVSSWRSGAVLDIHEEMMRVTLRVVVRALFAVETIGTEQLSHSLNTIMLNSLGARLLLPPFFRYLPLRGMRDVRRAVSDIDAAVYGIVRQHLYKEEERSGDLLSTLINARDQDGGRMTDQQLRDELVTFLLAGHETTALALSWALYMLGKNAEAETRLHQEVDRVLKGKLPTIADLPSLAFTENVIKETMRLYPPAWSVARTAINEFVLDGYRIPGGANIVMSQWITQRDARFFSEPERFDPDRWSTCACQNLPRFAYFPFGGGPRQCIGATFAMTEAVLLLATIARKFRLLPVEQDQVVPVPSLTLRPKDGIRMELRARC
jgi:cytochrome P450